MVHRDDDDFMVKFHGDATGCSWMRPMSDNKESQTLEAAWVMTELLKWQWRHGLRALPESGATFSMFLSHKCGDPQKMEWMTMPRYFERTVTASNLHTNLQTMFKLLDMFRLPDNKSNLLVDTA